MLMDSVELELLDLFESKIGNRLDLGNFRVHITKNTSRVVSKCPTKFITSTISVIGDPNVECAPTMQPGAY